MTDAKSCPRCGSALLWNGRGYSCIACSYRAAESKSPSEKNLPVPKKKKPGEGKK
jgi:tRNA(Ile2) C34 agmatinyltransferase TiaS